MAGLYTGAGRLPSEGAGNPLPTEDMIREYQWTGLPRACAGAFRATGEQLFLDPDGPDAVDIAAAIADGALAEVPAPGAGVVPATEPTKKPAAKPVEKGEGV